MQISNSLIEKPETQGDIVVQVDEEVFFNFTNSSVDSLQKAASFCSEETAINETVISSQTENQPKKSEVKIHQLAVNGVKKEIELYSVASRSCSEKPDKGCKSLMQKFVQGSQKREAKKSDTVRKTRRTEESKRNMLPCTKYPCSKRIKGTLSVTYKLKTLKKIKQSNSVTVLKRAKRAFGRKESDNTTSNQLTTPKGKLYSKTKLRSRRKLQTEEVDRSCKIKKLKILQERMMEFRLQRQMKIDLRNRRKKLVVLKEVHASNDVPDKGIAMDKETTENEVVRNTETPDRQKIDGFANNEASRSCCDNDLENHIVMTGVDGEMQNARDEETKTFRKSGCKELNTVGDKEGNCVKIREINTAKYFSENVPEIMQIRNFASVESEPQKEIDERMQTVSMTVFKEHSSECDERESFRNWNIESEDKRKCAEQNTLTPRKMGNASFLQEVKGGSVTASCKGKRTCLHLTRGRTAVLRKMKRGRSDKLACFRRQMYQRLKLSLLEFVRLNGSSRKNMRKKTVSGRKGKSIITGNTVTFSGKENLDEKTSLALISNRERSKSNVVGVGSGQPENCNKMESTSENRIPCYDYNMDKGKKTNISTDVSFKKCSSEPCSKTTRSGKNSLAANTFESLELVKDYMVTMKKGDNVNGSLLQNVDSDKAEANPFGTARCIEGHFGGAVIAGESEQASLQKSEIHNRSKEGPKRKKNKRKNTKVEHSKTVQGEGSMETVANAIKNSIRNDNSLNKRRKKDETYPKCKQEIRETWFCGLTKVLRINKVPQKEDDVSVKSEKRASFCHNDQEVIEISSSDAETVEEMRTENTALDKCDQASALDLKIVDGHSSCECVDDTLNKVEPPAAFLPKPTEFQPGDAKEGFGLFQKTALNILEPECTGIWIEGDSTVVTDLEHCKFQDNKAVESQMCMVNESRSVTDLPDSKLNAKFSDEAVDLLREAGFNVVDDDCDLPGKWNKKHHVEGPFSNLDPISKCIAYVSMIPASCDSSFDPPSAHVDETSNFSEGRAGCSHQFSSDLADLENDLLFSAEDDLRETNAEYLRSRFGKEDADPNSQKLNKELTDELVATLMDNKSCADYLKDESCREKVDFMSSSDSGISSAEVGLLPKLENSANDYINSHTSCSPQQIHSQCIFQYETCSKSFESDGDFQKRKKCQEFSPTLQSVIQQSFLCDLCGLQVTFPDKFAEHREQCKSTALASDFRAVGGFPYKRESSKVNKKSEEDIEHNRCLESIKFNSVEENGLNLIEEDKTSDMNENKGSAEKVNIETIRTGCKASDQKIEGAQVNRDITDKSRIVSNIPNSHKWLMKRCQSCCKIFRASDFHEHIEHCSREKAKKSCVMGESFEMKSAKDSSSFQMKKCCRCGKHVQSGLLKKHRQTCMSTNAGKMENMVSKNGEQHSTDKADDKLKKSEVAQPAFFRRCRKCKHMVPEKLFEKHVSDCKGDKAEVRNNDIEESSGKDNQSSDLSLDICQKSGDIQPFLMKRCHMCLKIFTLKMIENHIRDCKAVSVGTKGNKKLKLVDVNEETLDSETERTVCSLQPMPLKLKRCLTCGKILSLDVFKEHLQNCRPGNVAGNWLINGEEHGSVLKRGSAEVDNSYLVMKRCVTCTRMFDLNILQSHQINCKKESSDSAAESSKATVLSHNCPDENKCKTLEPFKIGLKKQVSHVKGELQVNENGDGLRSLKWREWNENGENQNSKCESVGPLKIRIQKVDVFEAQDQVAKSESIDHPDSHFTDTEKSMALNKESNSSKHSQKRSLEPTAAVDLIQSHEDEKIRSVKVVLTKISESACRKSCARYLFRGGSNEEFGTKTHTLDCSNEEKDERFKTENKLDKTKFSESMAQKYGSMKSDKKRISESMTEFEKALLERETETPSRKSQEKSNKKKGNNLKVRKSVEEKKESNMQCSDTVNSCSLHITPNKNKRSNGKSTLSKPCHFLKSKMAQKIFKEDQEKMRSNENCKDGLPEFLSPQETISLPSLFKDYPKIPSPRKQTAGRLPKLISSDSELSEIEDSLKENLNRDSTTEQLCSTPKPRKALAVNLKTGLEPQADLDLNSVHSREAEPCRAMFSDISCLTLAKSTMKELKKSIEELGIISDKSSSKPCSPWQDTISFTGGSLFTPSVSQTNLPKSTASCDTLTHLASLSFSDVSGSILNTTGELECERIENVSIDTIDGVSTDIDHKEDNGLSLSKSGTEELGKDVQKAYDDKAYSVDQVNPVDENILHKEVFKCETSDSGRSDSERGNDSLQTSSNNKTLDTGDRDTRDNGGTELDCRPVDTAAESETGNATEDGGEKEENYEKEEKDSKTNATQDTDEEEYVYSKSDHIDDYDNDNDGGVSKRSSKVENLDVDDQELADVLDLFDSDDATFLHEPLYNWDRYVASLNCCLLNFIPR